MANLFQLAAAKVLQDYNRNRSIAAAAADRLAADSADRDLVTPFRGGGGSPMPAAATPAPAQQQKKKSIWAADPADVPEPAVTPAASASRADILEAALDRLRGRTRATQATGTSLTSPQGLQAFQLNLPARDWTAEQKKTAEEQARQEVETRYGDGKSLSLSELPRYQAALDRIPQRTSEILQGMEQPQNPLSAESAHQRAAAAAAAYPQKHAEAQKKYADLMTAQEQKSIAGATPAQYQKAQDLVEAEVDYQDLVRKYDGNFGRADDEMMERIDEKLLEMMSADRAAAMENLTATVDPQASDAWDFVHSERLSGVFNPFTSREEMEQDLQSVQAYRPAGTGDAEYNGALAQRTAGSIRQRMAYQDDPEKALAEVEADIERLKGIRDSGAYDKAQTQELIWQQERQAKILQGYIAAQQAGDKWTEGQAAYVRDHEGSREMMETMGLLDTDPANDIINAGGVKKTGAAIGMALRTLVSQALPERFRPDDSTLYLGMMTQEERQGYYALYAQDKAAAQEYMEGMHNILVERQNQTAEEYRDLAAERFPEAMALASEAESLATEVLKPLASADVVLQNARGQEITRGGWQEYVATQGDKNAERTKEIIGRLMTEKGASPEVAEAGKAIYGVLHNAAANVTRAAASTALGVPSVISTMAMAFGTVAGTYYNQTDSTVGTTQAQRMGVAAGDAVSEFLTEALSDAHVFDAVKTGFNLSGNWWKNAAQATWDLLLGGVIESGTEVLNDVASQEWHDWMLGSESEANRRLDAYYRQALAGDYANDPQGALTWAQEQAYRDTMAGLWETTWTSFASGGVMDIGGRVYNRIATSGERRAQRQQEKLDAAQAVQAAEEAAGDTGEGSHDTVNEALEAIRENGTQQDDLHTPQAPIDITPRGAAAGVRQAAEAVVDARDVIRREPTDEAQPAEAETPAKPETRALEDNVAAQDETDSGWILPLRRPKRLTTIYEGTEAQDQPRPKPETDTQTQERPETSETPAEPETRAQEDTVAAQDETDSDWIRLFRRPKRLTTLYEETEAQNQPRPKPETDTQTQERPAEQAQDAVQLRDAMEAESAGITQPAGTRLQRQPEETQGPDARQPAPRPVSGYQTMEQQEAQQTEPEQAQPRDTGSTEAAAIAQPQTTGTVQTGTAEETRAPARKPGPIVRDEETVNVREDTPNRPAVQAAADVIRDERTADGVAEVLTSLPADKAPTDDAEGRADVQVMGDAYAAGMRGESLPDGGLYDVTPERKGLAAQANAQGKADLAAKTAEIARKNAAIAESTGFRDGAKYARHMNGVNLQGVTADLTAGQKLQLGVLDAMGRKFGIDFRIYDSLGNKNAMYRKDSGQVDISLAADGGLVKAASHELYHYISAWNKDAASQVRTIVLDYLRRAPGYDLDTRVQEVAGAYINAGEHDFDPLEEIVADSMLDMLADDAAKLSGAIYTDIDNAKDIASKAAEHIKRVGEFLREQLDRITGKSPEIRALHDQSDYVNAVGDILRKSILDATRNRQAQTYNADLIHADQRGIVAGYYNQLEEQYTQGAARNNMNQKILRLLTDADGNPLHLSAAEGLQRLGQAFADYTSGNKSMAKALEDQGMKAPDEDLIRVAVFAAREAQAQTEAQAVQAGAYTPSITYDDDFDSMARAGQTYGGVDKDHEAHLILQKIFDILKRGRTWQTDQESLQPGQWAADLDGIVDDIKRTTGTRTAADRIKTELRAMYTALDEALLRGEDFGIGQAVTYARRIAEMISEKAGQRIELEDDALTDMMRSLRGKTITLSQAQADEARARYGNIRALNNAYRGLVSFSTKKTTAGSMTLEDLQAEHGIFFGSDLAEGDLFTRLEDLATEYRGQREGMVDYNGLTRTEFERDLALRIVGGYFDLNNGTVSQTAGKTNAKTPGEQKYVDAVRQLRTEYNRRTRELEADYQRKAEQMAQMSEDEIEAAKQDYQEAKRRITSNYEYQIAQTAAALGTPLSAETRARLNAGMDLEEASMSYLQMRQRIEAEIERRAEERAERLAKGITRGEINGRAQEVVNRRIKRWQDAGARQALRKNVEKTVNDFAAKLMHPTDKKHAPEEMRLAFAKVLNLVNTSNPSSPGGFRTLRWKGVQNWLAVSGLLEQYSDDMSVMFDENLVANITWLQEHAAGKSIMQMDVDELRTLSETITSIRHTFEHYDEMLTEGQNQRISEIAEPINVLANERHNEGKAHKRQDGWKQQLAKQLQGSWMDPIRWRNWADRMTGGLKFGSRVHGMLRDAQDKQIRGVQEAEKKFGTWLAGVNRKQLETMHGQNAGTISVPHGDGEIRMTRGQAMSLYLLMQREQAVGHILGGEIKNEAGQVIGKFPGGGFTIGEADSKDGKVGTYKPIEATREEIEAILDQLTPAEKALADGTREIMDWCSELGNEVSMAMYGYNKYLEKNYFPIKTDPHYTSQTLTADNSNPLYRLKNQGFSKELQVNANSPLLVRDIFDVVRDHAVGMVNYNAWVIPALDITRVLNYKLKDTFTPEGMPEGTKVNKTVSTTSQALEILMGENGQKYIDQLLKDINGIKKDDVEKQGNTAQTLLSRFKGGAVAYNLSTAMKQPWSITRAWATIGLNYFTPGRQKGCSGDVNDIMKEYSPIYAWKQYGNFVLELGKSMDQILYPQMEAGVVGWINDKSMALPGWADNVTWRNIWRAAEKKTAHDHPDLTPGTDAFYQAVALEFRECIDQTQVVDGIMQRTQYMRSPGGFAKMTTSFMGEPMKSFNLFTDAVAGVIQTEKGSEARKKAGQALARGAVVYGVSSMTMAVVSSFVSAFRHWDGDEPWAKTFIRYLLGFGDWEEFKESSDKEKVQGILGSNLVGEFSILNKLPILRDLLTIASGWDVERTDMSAIKDLVDSAFRLWQSIAGNGKTAWPKAARDFLGYVSTTFGMPIGNLMKEIGYLSNGFALGAQQITGYDTFEWQYFNMRMNLNMDYISNSSSYVRLMYRAEKFGNQAMSDHIRQDLINAGVKEKNIDSKLRALYKAEAADSVDEYAALLEAGKKDEAEMMRQGFGNGPDAFDDAVEDMIRKENDVAEANYARKNGDLKPMQDLIAKYRKLGYDDNTIWAAVNKQYNETQEEDDQVSVSDGSMWLTRDLTEAVFRGDSEDIKYIVNWMKNENGKKTSTIKSGVTKEAKAEYNRLIKAGDTLGAKRLKDTLLAMGLGYTDKEIQGWLDK